MNILHINKSDISGGAAIAGYRLHQGLLAQGVDSKLLVDIVKTHSDLVTKIPRQKYANKQLYQLTKYLGMNDLHVLNTFKIVKHPFYQNAEVINFHNLHVNYFNYLAIPSLTANKPAIFTLHDMWAFTGHCAYSYDCERWKIGCGQCPYLTSYPAIQRDNTHWEWKLKDWVYSRSHLTIVTPSKWLAEQTQKSILNRFPIYHIPHGLDTQIYQPLEQEWCRALLGLPTSKKVIMFGAASLKDSRKGGDLLLKALQSLPESLKVETIILTIGHGGKNIADAVGIATLNLGYVSHDRLKAIIYSAADLFVFPSRADIFGLVLQESMACGTPLVAFKVGGVPDIVRPGITGYLAEPENVNDFRNGIVQLLEDKQLREQLSQNCRTITVDEYSLELQVQSYINLYHQVLNN